MPTFSSKIKGILVPPDKSGALTKAGEWRYDTTTGAMVYRDGVAGVDRELFTSSTVVPTAVLTNSATQTPVSGAAVTLNTVLTDTNGMTGTANKITIQTAGTYQVSFNAESTTALAADTNDWRLVVRKNSVNIGDASIPRGGLTCAWSRAMKLAVGDVLDLVYVASASPFTIGAGERNLTLSASMAGPVGVGTTARVTSLPGSPSDGQEVYYVADATNGITWHLRYNSTSSKWEFIGGGDLFSEVVTAETTASATYAALATAGPSIVVPLAGDYEVAIGCQSFVASNTAAPQMSYDIGGTAAVDADRTYHDNPGASAYTVTDMRERVKSLTAVTLTAKYKVNAATATFQNRWMRVRPRRIG